jgi:hypothetical protein
MLRFVLLILSLFNVALCFCWIFSSFNVTLCSIELNSVFFLRVVARFRES